MKNILNISCFVLCTIGNCFGRHNAFAVFNFYNSLSKEVVLEPDILKESYSPSGFKQFEKMTVEPKKGFSFCENLTNYQEISDEGQESIMLRITVKVGSVDVGTITLVRSTSPDPIFVYETQKNKLGLVLRIKNSRFGGGARVIEIAHRLNR